MSITLEYFSPTVAHKRRFSMRFALSALAMLAAVATVSRSTFLAQSLIEWGDCGIGRHQVGFELFYLMPLTTAIPAACWYFANKLMVGVLICRLSFAVAIVGWLVSILFVLK